MPHHSVESHWVTYLGLLLAAGPGFSASADSSTDILTIDPTSRRAIGGVVELDRQTFFSLSDQGKEFDQRMDSPERMEFLLGELNITFGRQLGPVNAVTHWSKAVHEDPQRPGYVDIHALNEGLTPPQPGPRFHYLTGGRLDVAAHGRSGGYPEFMGAYHTEDTRKDQNKHSKGLPQNIDAAAEYAAAVMAFNYTDFDRPRFYEPINEPHWSFVSTPHLAEWHVATMQAVQQKTPDVLVGGPCLSIAYFYKRNYNAFNGLRNFIANTDASLDFYSFHVYDYMKWDGEKLVGRVTTGLPLEGMLDLVQSHTVQTYGKEVDIVVSEHGGYINDTKGVNADKLGELMAQRYFPDGQGFEHTMRKRSVSDHILVSSIIANTMVFMDHPHVVKKAVPFILLHSMNWDPEYYSVVYTAYDFKDKQRWVETRTLDFYRLFRDVKGDRVVVSGGDPDVQAQAFLDDRRLVIVLNNLSERPESLTLRAPEPNRITIRRYTRGEDLTPSLAEETIDSLENLTLSGRETAIVTAHYENPIQTSRTIQETVYYSDFKPTEVTGGDTIQANVKVAETDGLAYAQLRISMVRPGDAEAGLRVSFNGQLLNVPAEDSADRYRTKDEFATTKIIAVDPGLVKENNTVSVGFHDQGPGAIGSVVLRAGVEE